MHYRTGNLPMVEKTMLESTVKQSQQTIHIATQNRCMSYVSTVYVHSYNKTKTLHPYWMICTVFSERSNHSLNTAMPGTGILNDRMVAQAHTAFSQHGRPSPEE